MADRAEIVLEGWVDKRGSRLHGWKKRYAKLTFDRVVFSQDEHSEPRGHWALRDFLAVIKEATRFRQHPNCLCLVHPTSSNRYFEPSAEAHLWLDCIQSLLQHTTPQIVLTRRVQRWLDQAAAHVTQGSLDMDAATPQIPDQPHVDTSSASNTISTTEDPNRKRGVSHSSVHTILDASPAVGTLNAQMDPTAWKPAGGRKLVESGLDIVDEDPPLDDLGVRSVGSMEQRSHNQQFHHSHHHQETHDDDDDEVDIRSDDDDENGGGGGGANAGDHKPSQAQPKSPRNYAVPHGDS